MACPAQTLVLAGVESLRPRHVVVPVVVAESVVPVAVAESVAPVVAALAVDCVAPVVVDCVALVAPGALEGRVGGVAADPVQTTPALRVAAVAGSPLRAVAVVVAGVVDVVDTGAGRLHAGESEMFCQH